MIVEWRFIKLDKYPDRIICDNGQVYNSKGRPLRLKPGKGGYLRVRMYRDKKETYTWVHRMVAHAFHEDVSGKDVHHRDKNRRNNRSTNLVVMTEQEHINEHKNGG